MSTTPGKLIVGLVAAAAIFSAGFFVRPVITDSGADPADRNSPKAFRYRAAARVQMNPVRGDEKDLWIPKRLKMLESPALHKAVEKKLNLTARWNLAAEAVLGKLSRMVKAEQETGTDLVKVTVRSDNKEEAVEIAGALVEAVTSELEARMGEALRSLTRLVSEQIGKQETAVEKARLTMLDVMKKYDILDFSPLGSTDSAASPRIGSTVEELKDRQKFSEYATAKFSYESQLQLLNSMREHAMKASVDQAYMQKPVVLEEAPVALEGE